MFISSWRRYCKRARDITDSIDVLGHFWHATSLYPSLGFRFDRGAGQATGVNTLCSPNPNRTPKFAPGPRTLFRKSFSVGPRKSVFAFWWTPRKTVLPNLSRPLLVIPFGSTRRPAWLSPSTDRRHRPCRALPPLRAQVPRRHPLAPGRQLSDSQNCASSVQCPPGADVSALS